jgi:hypothetical protein
MTMIWWAIFSQRPVVESTKVTQKGPRHRTGNRRYTVDPAWVLW